MFFNLSPDMAAAAIISVRDVLSFHKIDREIYDLLVMLGTSREVARNIVALFMWLETMGIDILVFVKDNGRNTATILRLSAEAEAILDFLRHDAPPSDSGLAIPLTASLMAEPLSLRFFYCHRDVAVRGIARALDGVGTLIFDDELYALLARHEEVVRAVEGEARRQRERLVQPELPPELARIYTARVAPTPEDCRSMFITFSKGFSIKKEEIIEYFNQKWGQCVERVMMERAAAETAPMYGRIIFSSESYIGLVLNGEQLMKFVIKGRQMWVRKYVPRKNPLQ